MYCSVLYTMLIRCRTLDDVRSISLSDLAIQFIIVRVNCIAQYCILCSIRCRILDDFEGFHSFLKKLFKFINLQFYTTRKYLLKKVKVTQPMLHELLTFPEAGTRSALYCKVFCIKVSRRAENSV